jgi:hypothetical protein
MVQVGLRTLWNFYSSLMGNQLRLVLQMELSVWLEAQTNSGECDGSREFNTSLPGNSISSATFLGGGTAQHRAGDV